MRDKRGLSFVLFLLIILGIIVGATPKRLFASGFNLKSIGGVNTDGRLYSRWYYTGLQPTFVGEAPSGTTIEIQIDSETYSVTADENGEWRFTPPTTLAAGEHQITLKNNGSTIAFVLVLGKENVAWEEIRQGGGEALPTVGVVAPTLALILGGAALSLIAPALAKARWF